MQVKGSLYEDDLITQILRVSLETVKFTSGKENILIIDDVDRLDHIFRILNILSARNHHFDSNKSGFCKVILSRENCYINFKIELMDIVRLLMLTIIFILLYFAVRNFFSSKPLFPPYYTIAALGISAILIFVLVKSRKIK